MLIFNSRLIDQPVASIQASSRIGRTIGYLINPKNLQIAAVYVRIGSKAQPLILHTADIRDYTPKGILIDHDNQLMEDDGLVRLKEIIDIDFKLIGKVVVTDSGHKIGKVSSFAVDTLTWLIMKIYAQPPLLKNVGSSELIFARSQIIKVSDTQVIVKGTQQTEESVISIKNIIARQPKPATYSESND